MTCRKGYKTLYTGKKGKLIVQFKNSPSRFLLNYSTVMGKSMYKSEASRLKKLWWVGSKIKREWKVPFDLFLALVFFWISSIRNHITIIVINLLFLIWTKTFSSQRSKKQQMVDTKLLKRQVIRSTWDRFPSWLLDA